MDPKKINRWGKYPTTAVTAKTKGARHEKGVVDYIEGNRRPMRVEDPETGKHVLAFEEIDVNPLKLKLDFGEEFLQEKGMLVKRKTRNPLYGILTHKRKAILYPKLIDEYVLDIDDDEIAHPPQSEKLKEYDDDGNLLERATKFVPDERAPEPPLIMFEGVMPQINEIPYPPDDYEGDVRFGSYVTFAAKKRYRGYISDMTPDTFRLIDPKTCKKSPPMPYPEKFIFTKKDPKKCKHIDTGTDSRSWGEITESEVTLGRLVTFTGFSPSSKRKGVVLAFSENAFWVSTPNSDELIPVGYNNPSVKVVDREKSQRDGNVYTAKIFSTILDLPTTDEIRDLAIDILYNRFSEIIPDVEPAIPPSLNELSEGDLAILQMSVIPWKVGEQKIQWVDMPNDPIYTGKWNVIWKVPGGKHFTYAFFVHKEVDPLSVKEMAAEFANRGYYNKELLKWYRMGIASQIERDMPIQDIRTTAEKLVRKKTSPVDIISEIKTRYGDDVFHIDAEELYLRLRAGKGSDDLDHELLGAIEMILPEDRIYTYDAELAKLLVGPIAKYIRHYDTEFAVKNMEQSLRVRWMSDQMKNLAPSKKNVEQFEKLHLQQIETLYREWIIRYLDVLHRRSVIQSDATKLASAQPVEEKGQRVKDQTIEFESRVFERYGFRTSKYLKHVLMPLVFLEGDLGKRARFFRAKLEAGVFEIQALSTANLAHYLPELMMNYKKLGTRITTALSAITTLNYARVLNFISMYSHYLNYRTYMPLPPLVPINWDNYLVSVLEECKSSGAMKGGLVARDEEGKIIYESTIVDGRERTAPKEKLADLTICYDADTEKFSCHDTTSILHDIKFAGGINPITEKPYQESLIERLLKERKTMYDLIKKRYFDSILLEPTFVDPEIQALAEEPVEEIEERPVVTGLFKGRRARGAFPNLEQMSVGQLRHFIKRKGSNVEIPRRMGDSDKVYKERLIELILASPEMLTGYSTLPPIEKMKAGTVKSWMKLEGIEIPKGTGKLRGKGGVGEQKRDITKEDIVNAIINAKYNPKEDADPIDLAIEMVDDDLLNLEKQRDENLGNIWGDLVPEIEEMEAELADVRDEDNEIILTASGEKVAIRRFKNPLDEFLNR